MRRLLAISAAICGMATVNTLHAQGPGAPAPGPRGRMGGGGAPGGPMGNTASFLLAHTGDLKLTDAQVVRLAAIARRADERMHAMRTSMDSVRPACGPNGCDSTARAEMRRRAERMRPAMERALEQSRTERRDAIAVLTPDQQGQAWDLVSMAGRRAGFGGGMRGRGRAFGPMGGRGLAPRNNDRRPGMPGPGMRRRPDGGDGPGTPSPDMPRMRRRPGSDDGRVPSDSAR
jgi:Spy/CpxP family protein refolding chaperone